MADVDGILASSPLSGLKRVSQGGGGKLVTSVCLAEGLADLDQAPGGSFVVLARAASAEAIDYRMDMALRWAAIHRVAAVAVMSADVWQPSATAADIAERAGIALVSVPGQLELSWLLAAIGREVGGGADRALGRAEQGLSAVLRAEQAGADLDRLREGVQDALGTAVEFHSGQVGQDEEQPRGRLAEVADRAVVVPVLVGGRPVGYFSAPGAHGDLAVAARLVLSLAASTAGRLLDLTRRASELPARSRSELLAELLLSDAALSEELLDRAKQLGVPVTGWHVAVRIEAENLDELKRDEVHGFELIEAAGQAALQAAERGGGTWYASRVARTVVLVRMSAGDPGPQAGLRAARSAEAALEAIRARLPGLRVRAGVGAPHEGPLGMRASAAEARVALIAARAAAKPDGVATHDAVGVQRMLMEWYASDTARASVRAQLEPLEKLGPSRGETAIRTLATYLDQQGSIVATAKALHLHRNAVTYRLKQITDLLGVDLDDPDQRLALQLACRARLLA